MSGESDSQNSWNGVYCVVRRNTQKNSKKSRLLLSKGQIWKTKDVHVRIVELGKMLVHYKLLRDLGQTRRTQMSRIDRMEEYLKANNARLIEDVSRN